MPYKNIPRNEKSVKKIENDIDMLRRKIVELEGEKKNTKEIKIDNIDMRSDKNKFSLGSHRIANRKNRKIKLNLDDESEGDL